MPSTATLKVPAKLKARIARLARSTRRSEHSVMLEALDRGVTRAEHMRAFVREALASDAAVEAGAAVYRAKDVHAWLERLAAGAKPARPRQPGVPYPCNATTKREQAIALLKEAKLLLTDDIVRNTIEKTRR